MSPSSAPVAAAGQASEDISKFPCSVTMHTPFPSAHLAQIALSVISVDEELSPLVRRYFSLASPEEIRQQTQSHDAANDLPVSSRTGGVLHDPSLVPQSDIKVSPTTTATPEDLSVLVTTYRATTHRMLRVSTNGFFESLGVVLSTMRDLDEGMLDAGWTERDEKEMYIGDDVETLGSVEKVELLRGLNKVQGLEERGRLDSGAG